MDDYGISQAITTGNNYIDNFNTATTQVKQLNDNIKDQAKRDLSGEGTTEGIMSTKDLITSAYGGYGFKSSATNWATKSKALKSEANAKALTKSISSSVKSQVSNTIPVSNGNEPSINLSGENAQRPATLTPDQAQQQQRPTAPKDDGEDEVRPAEPPAVDKPPEAQTGKLAKVLNITDETAEKLGKFGGIAGGLANAGMSIASDMHGGFHNMNESEKIGNVSSIIGGSAEAIGGILDATGVGAAVGVPLQVIGGLANIVGGLFSTGGDIASEQKKKQEEQSAIDKPDAPLPVLSATAQEAGVVPTFIRQQSAY